MKSPNKFLPIGLIVTWIAVAIPSFCKTLETDGKFACSLQNCSMAAADLDGDHHPDFAISKPQGSIQGVFRYRVNVHLTGGSDSSFVVDSSDEPYGVNLLSLDIDGDQDTDLVIISRFGLRLIGVWINDGHGKFVQSGVPFSFELIGLPHHPSVQAKIVRECAFLPTESRFCAQRQADGPIPPAHTILRSLRDNASLPSAEYNATAPFRAPPLA